MTVERPRGRTAAGEEIALDTWKAFSAQDLLNSLVVERMLAGVATRRHDRCRRAGRRRDRQALTIRPRSRLSRGALSPPPRRPSPS